MQLISLINLIEVLIFAIVVVEARDIVRVLWNFGIAEEVKHLLEILFDPRHLLFGVNSIIDVKFLSSVFKLVCLRCRSALCNHFLDSSLGVCASQISDT